MKSIIDYVVETRFLEADERKVRQDHCLVLT